MSNDFPRRRQIAEGILGHVDWKSDAMGYCECPGANTHSAKEGKRDCRITLDGVPTIFCLHQSCAEIVGRTNIKLRAAIAKGGTEPRFNSEERQRRERERLKRIDRAKREESVRECVSRSRETILDLYAWSEHEAVKASPIANCGFGSDVGRLFLKSLFRGSDVVWIGEKWDSGSPAKRGHFQDVATWLDDPEIDAPFICPATFKPGTFERKPENIVARPFIVLEGDLVDPICAEKLRRGEALTTHDKARSRAGCLTVINFFRIHSTFDLRAVVDSGSKSVQGWFDAPDLEEIDALRVMLPGFGFDPAVLRPSQPVRFPGVFRKDSGRWQKLLYLSPKHHD